MIIVVSPTMCIASLMSRIKCAERLVYEIELLYIEHVLRFYGLNSKNHEGI